MTPPVPPRIFIAGHRGMVGSAIVRQLLALGHAPQQLITRTHAELDLTDYSAAEAFFAQERPEYVYLAAAKVGGILATTRTRLSSSARTSRSRPT